MEKIILKTKSKKNTPEDNVPLSQLEEDPTLSGYLKKYSHNKAFMELIRDIKQGTIKEPILIFPDKIEKVLASLSEEPSFDEQKFRNFLNTMRSRKDVSLPPDNLIGKSLDDTMQSTQNDEEKKSGLPYEERLIKRIGPHALSERDNIQALMRSNKEEEGK